MVDPVSHHQPLAMLFLYFQFCAVLDVEKSECISNETALYQLVDFCVIVETGTFVDFKQPGLKLLVQ